MILEVCLIGQILAPVLYGGHCFACSFGLEQAPRRDRYYSAVPRDSRSGFDFIPSVANCALRPRPMATGRLSI